MQESEIEKLSVRVEYMKNHRCSYHTEKYYRSLVRQLKRMEKELKEESSS